MNHSSVAAQSSFLEACFWIYCINTLRQRQNGCHFVDDIFRWMFFNENVWILLKIPTQVVPKVQINNIPALVQIMAWCRPGDKPLSEPMMVTSRMHIRITNWGPDKNLSALVRQYSIVCHDSDPLHTHWNFIDTRRVLEGFLDKAVGSGNGLVP